jgi:hypothetical protein
MRLRVSDPALLPELVEFLARSEYVYAITDKTGDDELTVSLLGSYSADAMQMQLDLLVRACEAGRKGCAVEILD